MKNNKNFREDFPSSEEESLIARYENMQAQGRPCYFDVSECEDIIDYYGMRYEVAKAMQAARWAEKLHPQSSAIQLIKASLLAFDNKPRKALNIIANIEQQVCEHELEFEFDMFRLKISKIFALISIGKIKEALALQQDLLDNEATDSIDAEHVLTITTNGLLDQGEFEKAIKNLQRFEGKMQFSSTLLGYMA